MRRCLTTLVFVTALSLTLAIVGCRRDTTEPNLFAALTTEPFFITGAITETGNAWGYRVKGQPGTDYSVTDVYFSISDETAIRHLDGSIASAAELVVGRPITLWITGAIAESLPPQVGARLIVVR